MKWASWVLAAVIPAAALSMCIAVPAEAAPSVDEPVRLGGYRTSAAGAPVSVLLYEPVIPVPSEPQGELDLAYTRATIDTGPTTTALASTLWPGDALGQGFGTLTGQEGQEYPFKATAQYPGGPGSSAAEAAPGSTMEAAAGGRGAEARTSLATVPPRPALLATARSLTSASTTELAPDGLSVTARAVARGSDLELLGGIVRADSLRVESVATSDGRRGTTDGGLVVGGLTVLGRSVEVGQDGVVLPTGDKIPALGRPGGSAGFGDVLAAAGISFEVVPADTGGDGPKAARKSRALVVSVKTKPLRRMLDAPVGPVTGALPEDARAQLAPVLRLAPRIDIVLGNMAASAAANPPIGAFGPPGGFGSPGGTAEGGGLSAAPGPVGAGTAAPGGRAGSEQPVDLPVVAGDGRRPYASGGIPAALVAAAAVGSVLAGYGLRYVGAALLGGGAGSCELGSVRGVPDLREGR